MYFNKLFCYLLNHAPLCKYIYGFLEDYRWCRSLFSILPCTSNRLSYRVWNVDMYSHFCYYDCFCNTYRLSFEIIKSVLFLSRTFTVIHVYFKIISCNKSQCFIWRSHKWWYHGVWTYIGDTGVLKRLIF